MTRPRRSDAGTHKIAAELIGLIEGLALLTPPLSIATIHRRINRVARERGWSPTSYSSVYSIVRRLNSGLVTLAQEVHTVFRDKFELVHRHRAEQPNGTWQADHTELDILMLEANGKVVRPWLTTVIDDYSRVITGYLVFLGAPSFAEGN